jgi:hypothetical protein
MVGIIMALTEAGILLIIIMLGTTGEVLVFRLVLVTHGVVLGILLEDITLTDMTLGHGVQVVGDLEASSIQVGTRMDIALTDMATASMILGDMVTVITTGVTEIHT